MGELRELQTEAGRKQAITIPQRVSELCELCVNVSLERFACAQSSQRTVKLAKNLPLLNVPMLVAYGPF